MSLSSILESPSTTEFLTGLIRNPGLKARPPIAIERRSNPSRMGTAIDYAIRFGLEVRGGYPHQHRLVAESALRVVREEPTFAHYRDRVRDTLIDALYELGDLHSTPTIPSNVARACLQLAGLDTIVRSRRFEELEAPVDSAAVQELQLLYALTPWDTLRPREWGVLNPRFGIGSYLLAGADADVLMDGCLIDIKTVAKTAPHIRHIRQLVCYALIANRYGISRAPDGAKIDELAIYFTRAGYLHRFPLSACIAQEHHDLVLDHLVERGGQQGDLDRLLARFTREPDVE